MEHNGNQMISREEALLKKLRDIVLHNLDNEGFGVTELSSESGYSRSQLYRKIKTISGKSISDFIRDIRLEEALKLLIDEADNISEIAYRVGFNSPSYFSRAFYKKFGHTPLEIKFLVEKEGKASIQEKFNIILNGDNKRKKHRYALWITILVVMVLGVVAYIHFANQTPKPVLKHSYTFDDGTAHDAVGEAHGTIKGDSKILNGLFMAFKNGQYIELPADRIKINEYAAITLEAFLFAGIQKGYWTMFSFFGNTQENLGRDFIFQTVANQGQSASAFLCKNYEDPWNGGTRVTSLGLFDSDFHHVVTTFDNLELKLYIDGNLTSVIPNNINKFNKIENLSTELAYLCKSGWPRDSTWLGAIDRFNIYDGVLDPKAIAASAKKYLGDSKHTTKGFFEMLGKLSHSVPFLKPDSILSNEFKQNYKHSKFVIYPTIMKTMETTNWSLTSGKELTELLQNDLHVEAQFDDIKLDPGKETTKKLLKVFQNDLKILGKLTKEQHCESDYIIVPEILWKRKLGLIKIVQLNMFIFTPDGKNAFSFNLHVGHEGFRYAQLYEGSPSDNNLEMLIHKSTLLAFEALKNKLLNKSSETDAH